ncbi:MAG: hypothetical protein LAO05_15445 [Acidobacteriia bacterium]|nr:hypothetical protein [Terriglobia bacterium]
MDVGEIVVVSCSGPREKFWGVLLALTTAGATVRGIPLDTCEDWLRQNASDGPSMIGPVTIYVPAHRLERIEIDESSEAVECFADRFRRVAQREPKEALLGPGPKRTGDQHQM